MSETPARYEAHPIANIFPLLDQAGLDVLVQDIAAHGQRSPIWLYEGKILDGRNRAAACVALGIEPTTQRFDGTRREALDFAWSSNFHRRHLNPGQAALVLAERMKLDAEFAQEILEPLKEQAKERKKAGKGADGSGGRGKRKNLRVLMSEGFPEPSEEDRRTRTALARSLGCSPSYLSLAQRLLDDHPEKAAEVKAGTKTLSQVAREVKQEEARSKLTTLPGDKYRVVYADPPWSYGNSGFGIDQYGPAERHYPAMTIAQLCALDIQSIAEKDAVLFLWVTSPLLDECWPVIMAWGFEYKTSFVWDKVKHNYGHYNSVRHELLLVCTRGSCTPDLGKLVDSVVTVERSEKHSEKPEEFRSIIDSLYTHGKRIELFARKAADGWDVYGNEL